MRNREVGLINDRLLLLLGLNGFDSRKEDRGETSEPLNGTYPFAKQELKAVA